MKFNKILSMLLAVIMLSTAVIAAVPAFTASAANNEASTEFDIGNNIYITDDSFDDYDTFKSRFDDIGSAAELLEYELSEKQLMYANSADGQYTIYVNVYTGFMYYKNNVTGQILMSNYYNYSGMSNENPGVFSQIELSYSVIGSKDAGVLNSFEDSASYNQISVTKISNGLRVNYTIGDTKLRYLVPGRISYDRYMDNITRPILEKYLEAARERILETKINGKLDEAKFIKDFYGTTSYSTTESKARRFFRDYLKYYQKNDEHRDWIENKNALFMLAAVVMDQDITNAVISNTDLVKSGAINDFNNVIFSLAQLFDLSAPATFCPAHKAAGTTKDPDHCSKCGAELQELTVADYILYTTSGALDMDALAKYIELISKTIMQVFRGSNPLLSVYTPLYTYLIKGYKNAQDGDYVYCNISEARDLLKAEKLIEEQCVYIDEPTYSFNDMYKDEKEWNYVHQYKPNPVFRCALEYTFNKDGSLCVNLPTNSIAFDETKYNLGTITPLKYFGSGFLDNIDYNGGKGGFIFYPDGSGAVLNYKDFSHAVFQSAPIYGLDYAYSDISTIAGDYREQITMPVYGMVSTESVNEATKAITGTDTLNNGFFAIIEEGASLATLSAELDIGRSKFAFAYATYEPYPSDVYDLSQTLSVSGLGEHTMYSESKYSGSYKTRINMLTDKKLTNALGYAGFDSTYVGMAQCYREYLKDNGIIRAIAEVGNDIPLYIEAFGSMEVTKKILSFPVEVSMELTTFDDIRTMYDQFADAKAILHQKAVEYQRNADEEEKDLELKALYEEKAREYLALEQKIQNVTNINFRLTGFANGGMEYTYPSKVKWDKVVGGKTGFDNLLAYSNDVSARADSNLGIYPEFDFLYINNVSSFDGISVNKISSKLIDNRYASKQAYNSVSHLYEDALSSVVSADALAELYVKFNDDFADFNIKSVSVSTLGSDVNSNFDDDNPINRDEATEYISDLLAEMRDDGYDIMVNKGNAYSVEYASHIIDAYIDSSHLIDSSHPIPFYGMVLHGYVNYTGNALNYSGDPDYDILRSIESGASLYYILCYQNTEKMKEDIDLNKYYGVSYINWFDSVVEQYTVINSAIGDLQDYEIVNHEILKVERVIDEREIVTAYNKLIKELVANVRAQIQAKVNVAFDRMKEEGVYGKGVQVVIDEYAVIEKATEILYLNDNMQLTDDYVAEIKTTVSAYINALEKEFNIDKYPAISDDPTIVTYDDIAEYTSQYRYITDSYSTDGYDYEETAFTVNNYNVVLVTYRNATTGNEVKFVLNYNIFNVIVNIEGTGMFELSKYDFKVIK